MGIFYSRLSLDRALSANESSRTLDREVMIFEDVVESGEEENYRERFDLEAPSK